MPGWTDSTVNAKSFEDLPAAAQAYLRKIEALTETPIAIISTGPDRAETLILTNPFDGS
jgi:adenylosuccinate synthase